MQQRSLRQLAAYTLPFEYRRAATFFEPDTAVSQRIAEPEFRQSYLGYAGSVHFLIEQN